MDDSIGMVALSVEQSRPETPDLESLQSSRLVACQSRDMGSLSTTAFWNTSLINKGKPSVIQAYCQKAIEQGHEECIWLCIKRGKRCIAKDIQLTSQTQPVGIDELRKRCSWWKRHSLYSATGVKEVMMRFLSFNTSTNEVEVVARDFDYTGLTAYIDAAIQEACKENVEPLECGVDVMGGTHDDNVLCPNNAVDDIGENYCKVQRARSLALQKDHNKWLPWMLEFYWQRGVGSDAVEFLKSAKFVTLYSSLKEDAYSDAANPYGKTINAFMLVEGWHIPYLLCIAGVCLLCSTCVVAVATAVSHSFEAGLTAGSYALGLASILLAVLTFLSAVL